METWLADIETWFGLGVAGIGAMSVWSIAVAVWAWRRRRRPLPAGTDPSRPVPLPLAEPFCIVLAGSMASMPAWGMPLVWASPGAVPIDVYVFVASAVIVSLVFLGWGAVLLVRALRASGGRMNGWGRAALLVPWVHALAIGATFLREMLR